MDKERFMQSGLLEQYVLGLTTEEESAEVERYAAIFPEVEEEIDTLRKAMKHYAQEQIARLELKKESNGSSTQTTPLPAPLATTGNKRAIWLLTIGLLLSGVLSFHFYNQYRESRQQLSQLRRNLNNVERSYQSELTNLNAQLSFLLHNHTNYLHLNATPLAPGTDVRVFWNESDQKAFLQVFYLPPQPQGKQYHIWAEIDGAMKDLGPIELSEHHPQPIPCLPKVQSLNIALESKDTLDHPEEDQLYARVDMQ
ncbi:MAG: anti-sigma factor [Saprospiraceae bacterium]|nr:anti-sigma factor [Lewinella sp.]